jgi:nitroimidazol reductase NimA-like FMN-containing flavoprotein (pyridoxamine 5'-phosphate oxidase superfamily)
MLEAGVSGLPVVDDGRLVGIVTEADLVAKEAFPQRRRPLELVADMAFRHENRWSKKARGLTAEAIMSRPVRTAGPDDELSAAAARMVIGGVKRLPVVDDQGHLVGIISRHDVLTHADDRCPHTSAAVAAPAGIEVEPRTGLTVLAGDECWRLLRTAEVGRLAVAIDGQPDLFPINHVVDHGSVVFRTAEGTKLAAAVLGRGVAFEVDGYDADQGTAWSVVVKGRAVEIERVLELLDATDLPLFPWHTSPKPRYVRIEPSEVTGRMFYAARPDPAQRAAAPRRRAALE